MLGIRTGLRKTCNAVPRNWCTAAPFDFLGSFSTLPTEPASIQPPYLNAYARQWTAMPRPNTTSRSQSRIVCPWRPAQRHTVFVCHDATKAMLQRLYDGPFLVIGRTEKYLTINNNGTPDTVSIDRLKPAIVELIPWTPSPAPAPVTTRSARAVSTLGGGGGGGLLWRLRFQARAWVEKSQRETDYDHLGESCKIKSLPFDLNRVRYKRLSLLSCCPCYE